MLKHQSPLPSDKDHDINELCQMLEFCNLHYFHVEEGHSTFAVHQNSIVELTARLLRCHNRHYNLKVLALMTHHGSPLSESIFMMPARKEQREPWPNLKALYLREEDDDWLRRLSRFEELQVLSLRFASGIPAINRGAIEEIAKCQHLRAIELGLHELDDVEVLLNIARCPPLRKFSVPFFVQQEMEEDLLLGLLRALSYLEFFELGLKFRMDGAILHELACRCPRLTVLELHQTRLCLTLAQIENICRFPQLKVMRVKRLRFKNSRRLIQRRKVKITATEWRRIYPKLQNMPCPADIYSLQTVRDDSNEESEYTASVSSDDEESPREPGVDFNDYASDWFTLRTKLWRALGYGEDLNSPDRIPYIW